MDEGQLQQTVRESMTTGHARVLDASYLPADPQYLTPFVRDAQGGDPWALAHVYDGMTQLVYRLAHDYMRKWLTHLPAHSSFDDVFAEGLAGLQRGINDFDAESGNAFTTYATWWIRNGVQSAIYDLAGGGSIRAKALIRGVSPIDPLVGNALWSLDYAEEEDPLHAIVPAPEPEPFDVELVASIFEILSAVDAQLPQIIDLMDRKHAFREVARIVGLTEKRVRALHEQAQQAMIAAGY